jgi:cytochrome c biogenesis protein CcmG/thiol:disulfide interchange protein DsbE
VPLGALFALLAWSQVRSDTAGPGSHSVFDETGEAAVLRTEASDFALELFEGGIVSLSQFSGQVVLLDFWGSWCGPCRSEAAALERTWRSYRDRGVAFLGVAVFDTEKGSLDFIEEFDITYPNGPDIKGAIAIEYGLTGVPEKYFIDHEGRVVKKFVGPMDETILRTVLDGLLKDGAGSS